MYFFDLLTKVRYQIWIRTRRSRI
uniref:Uncharacterized protein n=1 Tax=Rhizophora mucronata TaxID=61149 RepID=A0A2P2M2M5_RHIMU